ncbi:MAG: ribosome silencing factor [Bifidobacteriaceae bacterium]|jgi:ribosome-associated protein|nr:ribosome silencing factor [Bifidobacteriaceae bacterium]
MGAYRRAKEIVDVAARAADRVKARSIMAIDVSSRLPLTDAFLIVTGTSERHVSGIVDEIEDRLREIGATPKRREGKAEARWVLLDAGEAVIHVQHAEDREFYGLDRLWKDCPPIELAGIGDGEAPGGPAENAIGNADDAVAGVA